MGSLYPGVQARRPPCPKWPVSPVTSASKAVVTYVLFPHTHSPLSPFYSVSGIYIRLEYPKLLFVEHRIFLTNNLPAFTFVNAILHPSFLVDHLREG